MNDARVDAPTPGSSSVEAYEEDWYRSLRALAERRASEFDTSQDEPEQAEDASPEGPSSEAPFAQTAAAGTETEPGTDEADAPANSPWAAPSLFDRSRPPTPAPETPQRDAWSLQTPTAAETPAEELGATGIEMPSSDLDAPDRTPSADDAPAFETRAEATTDIRHDTEEPDASAAAADTVPGGPEQKTSPWARVLRPLQRIQLSPLDVPAREEASVDEVEAPVPEALEEQPPQARTDVDGSSSIGEEVETEVETVDTSTGTDAAAPGFEPRLSVPDLLPPDLASLAAAGLGEAATEHAPDLENAATDEPGARGFARGDEHAGTSLETSDDDAQEHSEPALGTGTGTEIARESQPIAEAKPALHTQTEPANDLNAPTEAAPEPVAGTESTVEGDFDPDVARSSNEPWDRVAGAGMEPADAVNVDDEAWRVDGVDTIGTDVVADPGSAAAAGEIAEARPKLGEPEVEVAPGSDVDTGTGSATEIAAEPWGEVTADAAQPERANSAEAGREPELPSFDAPAVMDVEPRHEAALASEPRLDTTREAALESEPQLDTTRQREPASSLTSRDPAERKTALAALEEREPAAAELDTVAALILDPDAEIRRLAVETLSRTPVRLDDALVRQALQDPADEVRAAAVRAAATRGIRDLPTLATLVDARRSPETHQTVLELLPKILGEAQLTAEALDPLLLAIAQMQPPPDDDERAAFTEIAASIGTTLLIEGLTLPDARRLGAVRLLVDDRSHAVLRALADRAGDPLEEVRQAGLAAAGEIARIEAETARAAGPPDIGALAEDLRNPDPEQVEHALTTLSEVDRSDVVSWCRERLAQGDTESVAAVASLAAVLDLNEIGVELLTRGASLPSERRRPVIEALAEFPDPSQLAGFLAVVPSDRRADAVRLVWEASGRRILPDLRSLLADSAVEVRVAVIDIASDADDPASMEAVAGLLATDASPEVRAAAVRTISKTEGALPNIVRALGDPDPHVRATAVRSMPSSPASEVGHVLAQALTDLDERVRLAAIERLAGVSSSDPALAWSALRQCRVEERDELLNAFQRKNPNQILEIALEHLYSPDQDERKLAVEMTGWGASQAAVESAIRALGDPVPEVRGAAVGALGRLRDRSAVAALGKTLADPDADVRVGAVRALGVIDDEGVLAFLVAALKDPDHRVRETTSHVLTEWSSPAVAKRLAGVLAVPSLRDSAADLLRRIGPTSVELLIDVLIQGSAEIRYTVGPLLEQIIGIEEFLSRTDSLEPERRLRAIEALGAIAGPLAVDALMRSLSDPDERIRLRATQLLGELGDPIAADAVRRLVDDPVPDVAAAARYALETNLDGRVTERPAEHS